RNEPAERDVWPVRAAGVAAARASRRLLVEAGESDRLADPAAAASRALRYGLRAAAELSDAAVAGEHLGAVHRLSLCMERAGGGPLAGAGWGGVGDRGGAAGAAAGEVAGTAEHVAMGA